MMFDGVLRDLLPSQYALMILKVYGLSPVESRTNDLKPAGVMKQGKEVAIGG
jgi:hypothetical protein